MDKTTKGSLDSYSAVEQYLQSRFSLPYGITHTEDFEGFSPKRLFFFVISVISQEHQSKKRKIQTLSRKHTNRTRQSFHFWICYLGNKHRVSNGYFLSTPVYNCYGISGLWDCEILRIISDRFVRDSFSKILCLFYLTPSNHFVWANEVWWTCW